MQRKLKIRYRLLLPGLIILMIMVAGCQRGQDTDLPEITINLAVTPDPPEVGQSTVILTVSDAEGQPISGATLELEGNMNHAGMTPVFGTASEISPGRYEAPFQFTMGGDWFILVKAGLPDGRQFERQIDLPGVTNP